MTAQQLWYVRKGGSEVSGPYPAHAVARHVLLGRIKRDDEVSLDQSDWLKVAEVPELLPADAGSDKSDDANWEHERQMASVRWADERGGDERRHETPSLWPDDERRHSDDRRHKMEDADILELRRLHMESELMLRRKRDRLIGIALTVAATLAVLVVACVLFCPESPIQVPPLAIGPDCQAAPAPNVNWKGCDKAGAWLTGARLTNSRMDGIRLGRAQLNQADLGYAQMTGAILNNANLNQARLIAADLRNADLDRADLRGADLSYADLRGARMDGALLERARFDRAYWIDGRLCDQGSVGECR